MFLLKSAKLEVLKLHSRFVKKYITYVFGTSDRDYFIKLYLKILICFNYHLPATIYYLLKILRMKIIYV